MDLIRVREEVALRRIALIRALLHVIVRREVLRLGEKLLLVDEALVREALRNLLDAEALGDREPHDRRVARDELVEHGLLVHVRREGVRARLELLGIALELHEPPEAQAAVDDAEPRQVVRNLRRRRARLDDHVDVLLGIAVRALDNMRRAKGQEEPRPQQDGKDCRNRRPLLPAEAAERRAKLLPGRWL